MCGCVSWCVTCGAPFEHIATDSLEMWMDNMQTRSQNTHQHHATPHVASFMVPQLTSFVLFSQHGESHVSTSGSGDDIFPILRTVHFCDADADGAAAYLFLFALQSRSCDLGMMRSPSPSPEARVG